MLLLLALTILVTGVTTLTVRWYAATNPGAAYSATDHAAIDALRVQHTRA